MNNNLVYHYCGIETFLNIIRNHTLRLSDLCKSTDKLELKSLMNVVKARVMEKYKEFRESYGLTIYDSADLDNAFSYILQMVTSQIIDDTDQMLFGVCFSEEGDLLEQWREYADKGNGVAIGFERKWFEDLCKSEENEIFKFARVEYGYEKKGDTIVEKLASMIYTRMILALENIKKGKFFEKTDVVNFPIICAQKELYQESIFIKKEEYRNEKEWRLIINDENTYKSYDDWETYYNWSKSDSEESEFDFQKLIPKGMEFMVRNGKIVPYLDMKYDLDEDNMPIKEIIIGPNCKVDELDIFHLLEFFRFDGNNIEIKSSKSSYRL